MGTPTEQEAAPLKRRSFMSDANRIDVDQHVLPPVWAGTLPGFPATARFGCFLLDSHRRELLADGVPVPIGGRAFDVLIVSIEARGGLVTKDDSRAAYGEARSSRRMPSGSRLFSADQKGSP
jgi:hypothetical protein